jgi:hypothetical protein
MLAPMKPALSYVASALLCLLPGGLSAAPIADELFWQDVAVRIQHQPELTNAVFKKLRVDKENTVYVLTDKGVARLYERTLALDRSYRPLAGKIPNDIALTTQGDLAYRFGEEWLSNGVGVDRNPPLGAGETDGPGVLKAEPGMPWPVLTARVTVPGGV